MLIKFNDVTKEFGNGKKALSGVSFSVESGEFLFIQGKSGAGKTTIARLLLREFLPTSGTIEIDNIDISQIKRRKIPFLRRKIGLVFQDFKVLFDRTVKENIAIPLDFLPIDKKLAEERIQELLSLTGLEDKQDYFPVQLSGGELQRVVIARALAPQPKILFADEPTGNLDPDTAMQIIELLEDINDQGTAVMVATHNKDIVKKLKKRIIEIEDGKIVRDTARNATGTEQNSKKHHHKDKHDKHKDTASNTKTGKYAKQSDEKDRKEREKHKNKKIEDRENKESKEKNND